MIRKKLQSGLIALAITTIITGTLFDVTANPSLTPGVWADITPPGGTGGFGTAFVEIDPNNPATLYASCDQNGLYKSTNAGSNWTKMGQLDSPIEVKVDPGNSQHLYATQGVRGATLGFWISNDGGATFTMPAGFVAVSSTVGMRDITMISVDPSDFKHFILSSHSAWSGMGNAGIIESTDGGTSFIVHQPTTGFTAGTMGVNILSNPSQNIGNGQTWLVGTDGNGMYRTTNSGATWTKVTSNNVPHGGNNIFYSKTGVLYAGSTPYPIRSTDNGVTWQQTSTGLEYFYYYIIYGDGNTLYTSKAYAGGSWNSSWFTSPETNGTTWTKYNPLGTGAQVFGSGPYQMCFDKVNRIMYAACWQSGLFALKVIDPSNTVTDMTQKAPVMSNRHGNRLVITDLQRIKTLTTSTLYDIKGKRIGAKGAGTQIITVRMIR
jgi:hypothetical protein